jgi:hypothetical protein
VDEPMMSRPVFVGGQRAVALVAVGAVILQATAGVAFALVHRFDMAHTTDLTSLAARGPGTAGFFRAALLVDMLGYLAVAPVVLHLHTRLRAAGPGSEGLVLLLRVATFAGVAFSLVGAIGAALIASVGPPLIDTAIGGGPSAGPARVVFEAISNGVYVGLWGPLNWLSLGIWVGAVGWLTRREGRPFAALGILVGAGALAYAVRVGLSGRSPTETGEPIDLVVTSALGLFIAWELWLAARIWIGR